MFFFFKDNAQFSNALNLFNQKKFQFIYLLFTFKTFFNSRQESKII